MALRNAIVVGELLVLLLGSFGCDNEPGTSARTPTSTPAPDVSPDAGTAGPSENALKVFLALKPDPPPPRLAADVHFPTSNERFLYVWRDAMQPLGGVYIGVGTDQNFVLAGWSRPEVMVLMDFDQMVVDINAIYRLLFLNAPDPKSFIKLWSKKSIKEVEHIFTQAYPEKDAYDHLWKLFLAVRRQIEIRLAVMINDFKDQKVAFFLTDPEQYRYLVTLFEQNRVFTLPGDLTATQAVQSVAAAAKTANIPVRVLYLSNAERYFSYGEAFKQNMLALPFDEHTVVLRTTGQGTWAKGDPFWYVVQSGKDFQEWLKSPQVVDVSQLVSQRTSEQKHYLYTVAGLPPGPLPLPSKRDAGPPHKNAASQATPPERKFPHEVSVQRVNGRPNAQAPGVGGTP